MDVFHAIMDKAKQYGIAPSRLHIDPLVVTLSTDQTALLVFAECCRRIKAEYPDIHITSGLSNISYGLPIRKNINYAFMTLAMEAGMDSAIVDPTNQQMTGIIHATNALLGRDEFCLEYIESCKGQGSSPAPQASQAAASPAPESKADAPAIDGKVEKLRAVAEAVENGKNKKVPDAVRAALEAGVDPKDILNTGMIDAMDVVGDKFQKQIIFVPQMLAAARAMKSGVDVLKPHLKGEGGGSVGKMILGTVAGDFHDIGKNLVGMMIESAGVEVIDLGVDVPISTFIKAIEDHPDVTIVGLSALSASRIATGWLRWSVVKSSVC
jgi:5-methyltetrahydrofolate--homocysteine methyltransferase